MNSDNDLTTIHFEGNVSREIFLRLQNVHLGWRRFVVFPTALIVVAIFWDRNQELVFNVSEAIGAIVVAFVLFWWQRFSLLRVYKKSPYLQESLKGALSLAGLKIESNRGQSQFQWSDFVKSKYSDDVVLLYRGPNLMHFLAREFFDNEENWRQAKEIIRDHVIKK